MPFEVKVSRTAAYARYDVSGTTSLKRFARLIAGIADDVEQFEDVRVLVDLRQVDGRLLTSEQILVGDMAGRQAPMLYKLASLVPAGEFTGNSARAAERKGLELRVFISEAAALEWLLEGKPA
jgi:hypothetical protein